MTGLLLLAAAAAPARTEPAGAPSAAQGVSPEDAVVLVRTTGSLRRGRGSGFLIGDGSWVVTASHVVSVDLGKGRRASEQTVMVYSPWTGRPYEARVAAVDGVADVALLRLPQAGLPALPVEGLEVKDAIAARDALNNRPLQLFGFPLSYGDATIAALAKPEKNDTRLREVAKKGETSLCVLNACPDAQPGWSGGPVVSADRGTVVGIFHSLYRPKAGSEEAFPAGSVTGYLGDLLRRAGATDLGAFTRGAPAALPRPAGASERMAREMRSLSLSAGGNWSKAEEEQRAIVRSVPEDALARVELGTLLLAQQKDEEALTELREAARLAPRSVLAQLHYGLALHQNYDPKGALTALQAALAVAPGEIEPQLALAKVHGDNQRAAEAEAVLRKALAAAPEHPVLLFQLGTLLQRARPAAKGEDEGLKLLAQAGDLAQHDPVLSPVALGHALALEGAGKHKEAESRYRQIVQVDPQNAQVRYYAARLYLRLNRPEDAQIHLNNGINIPDLPESLLQAFRTLQERINERAAVRMGN